MKVTLVAFLVVMLLGTAASLAAPAGGSHPLALEEMQSLIGTGGCEIASGFRTGLGISGAVLAFIPGTQGAAAIAGTTALVVQVGLVFFC